MSSVEIKQINGWNIQQIDDDKKYMDQNGVWMRFVDNRHCCQVNECYNLVTRKINKMCLKHKKEKIINENIKCTKREESFNGWNIQQKNDDRKCMDENGAWKMVDSDKDCCRVEKCYNLVTNKTNKVCNKHKKEKIINEQIRKCIKGDLCGAPHPISKICDFNNLKYLYPKIALEWSYENIGPPENFSYGSTINVEWICSKNSSHKWNATINSRTNMKCGCPFCNNGKPCENNNFKMKYPLLALEWSDENFGTPEEFASGATKNVKWVCSKNSSHKWKTTINSRTSKKRGCPFCNSGRPCEDNNLKTRYPEIAKEWSDRNIKKPEEFSFGSDKIVWWRCLTNISHEWKTNISRRTKKDGGPGCPTCNRSKGEKKCETILIEKKIKYKTEHKLNIKKIENRRFDFYLSKYKLLIEYDGRQHFKDIEFFKETVKFEERQNIDILKTRLALKHGYRILRIDHTFSFDKIEELILFSINSDKKLIVTSSEMYSLMITRLNLDSEIYIQYN